MNRTRALIAILALPLLHSPAWADGCKDFKWDVSREQALFAEKASAVLAGADSAKAPEIQVERLYDVTLLAQESVRFQAQPGKKMISDGAAAGLLRVRLPKPGPYRVSVSSAFWLDVVSGSRTIPSLDFSGSHDCRKPRKVVVYELPADQELTLQLSGHVETQVLLSVTAVTGKP